MASKELDGIIFQAYGYALLTANGLFRSFANPKILEKLADQYAPDCKDRFGLVFFVTGLTPSTIDPLLQTLNGMFQEIGVVPLQGFQTATMGLLHRRHKKAQRETPVLMSIMAMDDLAKVTALADKLCRKKRALEKKRGLFSSQFSSPASARP